jgi:hypothetical protein
VGDPSDIVLAYGSAKFAPGGKGEMSVPTSTAFKECTYRFVTHVVDEFRTSKINYKDDQILERVKRVDKNTDVRGLLWCCSTIHANGKFVDRDVNGALNIRRCLIQPSRPRCLQRRGDSKLIQYVGKKISC